MIEGMIENLIKPPREQIIFINQSICPIISKYGVTIQSHVIQGIPLTFYRSGKSKSTILYIHSYNSGIYEVRSILNQLIGEFNVASLGLQRIRVTQGSPELDDINGIITFGFYEYLQVHPVVRWLRNNGSTQITLWGRSMGAVIAIKYQSQFKGADKLVLDSPYNDLINLFQNVFQQSSCFSFLLSTLFPLFKSQIIKILHFDPLQMRISESMNFNCPIYFICSLKDNLSNKSTQTLYKIHKGQKKIIYTDSAHNQHRQKHVIRDIITSIKNKVEIRHQLTKKQIYFIDFGRRQKVQTQDTYR